MVEEKQIILDVKHLSITFRQYEKGFRQTELPIIRDLNLTVRENEVVAVVGSSGSGKSLLAHGILGILPYNAFLEGTISYKGEVLDQKRKEQLRGHELVLVPQNVSYLNPLMKVGEQIRGGKKDRESGRKSRAILKRYGLEEETEQLYPFELSGGMTRRILISTAVMETPKLVIADEPTPGLHIEAAKRVLGHFREISDEGAGVLLITHDLELALEVADRIVVFYAGTTVEEALVVDFEKEETLRHPYTRALYRAMPRHGFEPTAGVQPYVTEMPKGCVYGPRCSLVCEACQGEIPPVNKNNGWVRCIRGGE